MVKKESLCLTNQCYIVRMTERWDIVGKGTVGDPVLESFFIIESFEG